MRPYRTLFAATAVLAFVVSALEAQMRNDHVQWELLTPSISGKPGDIMDVKVRLTTAPKAHIYSLRRYDDAVIGPQPTQITTGDTTLLVLTGDVASDPPPTEEKDPNFEDLPTEYWEGTVTLTIPVRIAKTAKRGEHAAWVNVYFMTCNDRLCRPPTDERFEIRVNVKGR